MKNKIYYITRSYHPYQTGGGPLMRKSTVTLLQELGWDVVVILPNYRSDNFIKEENVWQIPFKSKHIQKLASLLERIGIYEDYLDKWVDHAFTHLASIINTNDIIFATSGGELGTIKLGGLIKNKTACKFVVNFRDPLDYGDMNSLKKDGKFHVTRGKTLEKYISNADLILTSSQYYADVLKKQLPCLDKRIINNYFGFPKQIDTSNFIKKTSKKLRIAYSGSMLSAVQKPEILYTVFNELNNKKDVELYFIGNYKTNKTLSHIQSENIIFIDFMPHDDFLKFMYENIDVGFLSLAKDYYSACVPSKLYEYINLELPMLAALPEGDASNIINQSEYGFSCHYSDIASLVNAIKQLSDKTKLEQIRSNIIKDKEKWAMRTRINEVDHILQRWKHQ